MTRPLVVRTVAQLRAQLAARPGRLGLVPTMGALHAGHAALVERAATECDSVLVTVFVNPLQFGEGEDLDRYPRTLDADVEVISQAGGHLVFAPPVEEMYPGGRPLTAVRVGELSEVLDGASRPGHFDGVATVVTKLFSLAGPCRAYFGEKDWQQLVIVTRMARDLSMPVQVVPCATVREPDGVARSSRNVYLTPEQRPAATVLSRALRAGAEAVEGGERSREAVRARMEAVVGSEPRARLDYVDVVDAWTLRPVDPLRGELRLLGAAWVGEPRLIDNVGVVVP